MLLCYDDGPGYKEVDDVVVEVVMKIFCTWVLLKDF